METETILFLMFITLLAGYVDGIAGGGGLLVVPALLTAGIPPHYTLGTNKLASSIGVFGSAYAYMRKRHVNPLLWKAAILAALFGSMSGALVAQLFSSINLQTIMPIILIVVAIYMLFDTNKKLTITNANFQPKPLSSSILSGILSFYDGFLGPGTGSFWVTVVMLVYKLDIVQASGVARVMNFVSNITALSTFIYFNNVYFKLGLAMGLTYFVGSYAGANLAIRLGAKFIRPLFLTMVVLIALRLIWIRWF